MTIYILFFLILLLCAIFTNTYYQEYSWNIGNGYCVPVMEKIILFLLACFLCTGYMTGSDWRHYELAYDSLDSIQEALAYPKEYIFYMVCYISHICHIDFWIFWISIKFICFFITTKVIIKYAYNNRWWCILFFYSYFALYYYIDNPMRNLIAATIVLSGIQFFIEKKKVLFVFIIVAAFFHASTLLVAPFLLIASYKRLSNITVIVGVITLTVLLSLFWVDEWHLKIYQYMLNILGEDGRGLNYIIEDSKGITLGSFFLILIFLISVVLSRNTSENSISIYFKNMAFMYVITQILGCAIPVLSRLSMFFFMQYIIYVTSILNGYANIVTHSCKMLLCVFLIYVMAANIRLTDRYIPYSTYIEYLFSDKPSYWFRDQFNPNNSPYKNRSVY